MGFEGVENSGKVAALNPRFLSPFSLPQWGK